MTAVSTLSADQLFDRAVQLYQSGDRAGAGKIAADLVAAHPAHGDGLNLAAILAQDARNLADAEALIRRAVAAQPGNPIYLNTLGTTLLAQGRTDEAIAALAPAAAAAPQEAEILFNLANAYRDAGQGPEAAAAYQKVLALKPGHLGAYNNLALMLKAGGDVESAVTVLIEAIAFAPKAAELRFNLGNALHAAGRLDAAAQAYRRALDLKPDHVQAMVNLGVVLAEQHDTTGAEQLFRQAIARDPTLSQAYVGLADLVDDGSLDAVAHRRAVLALRPDLPAIWSSLLMCLHYADKPTRAEIAAEHRAFGRQFGRTFDAAHPPAYAARPVDFTAGRKLRLGVMSGDFRFHAMLFFALPVFEARDKSQWDLTCYSTTARPDDHTRTWRADADRWRDVRHLSAGDLAELIVRDGIDVLIDLSGHAPHNRLPAFALKPAPLQVAWGDYVNTRGLAAIDVLLGDPVHTPVADDGLYVEKVVRLPRDYVCYRPPAYTPPVAGSPCASTGVFTFGCFSEVTKIGPSAAKQWAAVLKALPAARMLFNNYLFADGARQGRVISLFMDQGIDPERIVFAAGGPHAEFLAQYAQVDAILDTAPYSGGLTTCEALVMGVPVLTVTGDRFCGRHASAHLINGGYPDGVCGSLDELVEQARALAATPPTAMSAQRRALRAAVLASPLCDVRGFARDFYAVLRAEWDKVSERKA
ncbi:MAG: tetratricopeptide repeat protein [Rhodospirillaceae bacterium]|nr:tetratricopeptide repeat protein [Rhodospirillaceae bacterium]